MGNLIRIIREEEIKFLKQGRPHCAARSRFDREFYTASIRWYASQLKHLKGKAPR